MRLVIVLAALALERYAHIGAQIQRFNWFESYVGFLHSVVKSESMWESWPGFFIVNVPLWVVVGIVYYALCNVFFGLFGLILGLIIVWYCLGPDDLFKAYEDYKKACEGDNKDAKKDAIAALLGKAAPKSNAATYRALTETISTKSYNELFSVILWFCLLGPLGALVYRVLSLSALQSKEAFAGVAATLKGYADWIPTRLTVILFSFAGNAASFKHLMKHLIAGPEQNEALLFDASLTAINVDKEGEGTAEETQNMMDLVERSFIVLLVILAVFVVGTLL